MVYAGFFEPEEDMEELPLFINKGGGNALIIIDMLNDFLSPDKGKLYVAGMPPSKEVTLEELIANVKFIGSLAFDLIATVEDFHPAKHKEFDQFG